MSCKLVIIMVGIWLGVTFASGSRSHLDFLGCVTVQCVFTVDNVVNSVTYNNNPLAIIGNANNWRTKKEISFESCAEDISGVNGRRLTLPGVLTITGRDQNDSDHCKWGGLLLHCTASQNSSPWHNFVSDATNWKDENGNTPCQNDEVFPQTGAGIPFIDFLNQKGAKKIWTTEKTATLMGSPAVSNVQSIRLDVMKTDAPNNNVVVNENVPKFTLREKNKTLEWVEEIRGRMSQKLQGYNQKLIAFGSSMSETLEELTNALELEDTAVEVIEKICSKKGVTQIGKVIKCGRNCGTINYENYSRTRDRSQLKTITCSSTSCSLHCNQVSSCQVMTAHESTWMIECSETSTCQSLNAKCTEGKTCFAKCSGTSSCQGAVWTGNWLVECSGPSSC